MTSDFPQMLCFEVLLCINFSKKTFCFSKSRREIGTRFHVVSYKCWKKILGGLFRSFFAFPSIPNGMQRKYFDCFYGFITSEVKLMYPWGCDVEINLIECTLTEKNKVEWKKSYNNVSRAIRCYVMWVKITQEIKKDL